MRDVRLPDRIIIVAHAHEDHADASAAKTSYQAVLTLTHYKAWGSAPGPRYSAWNDRLRLLGHGRPPAALCAAVIWRMPPVRRRPGALRHGLLISGLHRHIQIFLNHPLAQPLGFTRKRGEPNG